MFEQIKLGYEFDALEPYIDAETMATHYGKHHATYTTNLNKLAEQAGKINESIEDILAEVVEVEDIDLRTGLRNNGGGYYNPRRIKDSHGKACGEDRRMLRQLR